MEVYTPAPLEETDPELAKLLIAWSQNHPKRKLYKKPITIDQLVGAVGLLIDGAKKRGMASIPMFWNRVWAWAPDMPVALGVKNLGRNDKCWCESGKKYKKCCLGKE